MRRVQAGERVLLECAPHGDQPMRLTWLRNGLPVNPTAVKVECNEQIKVFYDTLLYFAENFLNTWSQKLAENAEWRRLNRFFLFTGKDRKVGSFLRLHA